MIKERDADRRKQNGQVAQMTNVEHSWQKVRLKT
jgi:hypothetical protein